MLRVMCDRCGKELAKGETHHVVKIEAFANAAGPAPLTDDDLDRDHLEEVAEMLAEADDAPPPEPASASLRYDMCGPCRRLFLQNPLAREVAPRLHISMN